MVKKRKLSDLTTQKIDMSLQMMMAGWASHLALPTMFCKRMTTKEWAGCRKGVTNLGDDASSGKSDKSLFFLSRLTALIHLFHHFKSI
jgi:hypothetical protein